MRKHLRVAIILCISILPMNAGAEGMNPNPKGAGARANTTNNRTPQPPIRKSIKEYAKEYGYGGGVRDNTAGQRSVPERNLAGEVPRGTMNASVYARNLSNSCSGHWKKENCLKSTGYLSRELVNDYHKKLLAAGNTDMVIPLQQECEDAGKVMQRMTNEETQEKRIKKCNDAISDIAKMTNVAPDKSMYRMSSWSAICLGKGRQCEQIEKKLAAASGEF